MLTSRLEKDLTGPAGTVLVAEAEGLVVGCRDGAVALTRVQRAGKPPVDMGAFLRGTPLLPGHPLSMAG